MSLQYVLEQVGYKVGLKPSVEAERKTLLRFVNAAAKELYHQTDMAGCLMEEVFKVYNNQTIALPSSVGQIRAMREFNSHNSIDLTQMRPRYNQFNWPNEWRSWRIKGLSPLQATITNQSQLVLTVKAVENPPVVVSISGPIDGASCVSENITMDAITKTSVHPYLDVTSVKKDRVSTYDITISDVDGLALSVIPNNRLSAAYQIVDISAAPWFPPNQNTLFGWVEVLYKKALPVYLNDSDEFPATGYDDVWVNKTLQLWFEEQSNITMAVAYQTKANQMLAQIHEDINRGTKDKVAFTENPHDRINPKVGYGRYWQYAYRPVGR